MNASDGAGNRYRPFIQNNIISDISQDQTKDVKTPNSTCFKLTKWIFITFNLCLMVRRYNILQEFKFYMCILWLQLISFLSRKKHILTPIWHPPHVTTMYHMSSCYCLPSMCNFNQCFIKYLNISVMWLQSTWLWNMEVDNKMVFSLHIYWGYFPGLYEAAVSMQICNKNWHQVASITIVVTGCVTLMIGLMGYISVITRNKSLITIVSIELINF